METQENFNLQENAENAENAQVMDRDDLERTFQEIRDNQNLPRGIVGGIIAGLIGSLLWAVISYVTDYQIGWMAIGIGFIIGMAVRIMGRGIDFTFGIVGAVISLFSVVLGNLLLYCAFIANYYDVPLLSTFSELGAVFELLMDSLKPIDYLFYGLAIYTGFKTSFTNLDGSGE